MTAGILEPAESAFATIGGEPTVDRLVEVFYRNMETLPAARTIRAMHGPDMGATKAVPKLYLTEWFGGADEYSRQRGHPRLRMRHMRFSIGPSERDAWMLCMTGALEEVVEDVNLRERLRLNFVKLAEWVRNDPDNEHDHDKHR